MGSVYISLDVPPENAKLMSIPGGRKPEDLHLTLAFIGNTTEPQVTPRLLGKICGVLNDLRSKYLPTLVQVTGCDYFEHGVLYATVQSEHLKFMRFLLVRRLSNVGIPVNTKYDFLPHITLCYPPTPKDFDYWIVPDIEFEAFTLHINGTKIEFPYYS